LTSTDIEQLNGESASELMARSKATRPGTVVICPLARILVVVQEARLKNALQRWAVMLNMLVISSCTVGVTLSCFTLYVSPWIKTFGASHGEIIWAGMGAQIIAGVFSPLMSRVVNRIDLRVLVAGGTVLLAATFWVISLSMSMWQVVLLYALSVGCGFILTGPMMGQILAVRLFARPGLAIGIVTLGTSLGGIVLPSFVASLLSDYGWRIALSRIAAGLLLLTPLAVLFLRADHGRPQATTEGALPQDMGSNRMRDLPGSSTSAILRDRVFLGTALTAASLFTMYSGLFFNLGPYVLDIGSTSKQAAVIISMSAFTSCAGTLCVGAVIDRTGYRIPAVLSFALIGGGSVLLASGLSYWMLSIVVPTMAFAVGAILPLPAAILAQHFDTIAFARANLLVQPFLMASSFGPIVVGVLRDRLGSYPPAFAALELLLVPGLIGLALLLKTAAKIAPGGPSHP
jgi:MFS family permease